MASVSDVEIIKLGIRLWFDARNTFKARAVVDGILAMALKLGAFWTAGRCPSIT